MAYQGTFAIITAALISGAIVERMRFGAYLVFIALWSAARLRAGRALGVGRRLAGQAGRARLRRRHGRPRQRRRRGARGRARARARARTTRARRSCRTTCRSRCSAPACSGSAGSASTPAARSPPSGAGGARVRQHDARAGGDARRLDAARPARAPAARRPSAPPPAIVVGLVAITPAAGFVGPMAALALGGVGALSRATSRCCGARARGSTTRSTWSPPTASAARSARCSPASSRRRRGTAPRTACSSATRASSACRRWPCWRAIVYSGVRDASSCSSWSALVDAAARRPRDEGLGLDVSQHGEEAYATAKARSSSCPTRRLPHRRPAAAPQPREVRA